MKLIARQPAGDTHWLLGSGGWEAPRSQLSHSFTSFKCRPVVRRGLDGTDGAPAIAHLSNCEAASRWVVLSRYTRAMPLEIRGGTEAESSKVDVASSAVCDGHRLATRWAQQPSHCTTGYVASPRRPRRAVAGRSRSPDATELTAGTRLLIACTHEHGPPAKGRVREFAVTRAAGASGRATPGAPRGPRTELRECAQQALDKSRGIGRGKGGGWSAKPSRRARSNGSGRRSRPACRASSRRTPSPPVSRKRPSRRVLSQLG